MTTSRTLELLPWFFAKNETVRTSAVAGTTMESLEDVLEAVPVGREVSLEVFDGVMPTHESWVAMCYNAIKLKSET